ncbi:hypothetical protein BDP55DRAFT_109264 [Colletotrichum godetiae]|uniref:Secreted protein n=1 Tax=Colletotrichum godetiae TaxID=1209918 RepID=A0AAJ0A4T6_9PEZI|nr:uncharacterized protein BDP55DRAFT_109264 [Colletotrichum godetiae]KAK1656511.1 hypothetical protein BDP55DRAFT_109264 [Colletotrichum godetiae]
MHVSSLLVALAATASAIDIRAHTGDNCAGGSVACTGINPNVCCSFSSSASSGRSSIAVVAIPSNWRIRCEAYTGGGCSFFGGQRDSGGATSVCLPYTTRGDRTGGKYWFLNRKRAIDESCLADQPDGGECEASVKPDTLGLADGTDYDITGLTDEKVQEFVSWI